MPLRLTVEIDILYDVLVTGVLVFESNLPTVCASTTLFPKTDTVALALWASIYSSNTIYKLKDFFNS